MHKISKKQFKDLYPTLSLIGSWLKSKEEIKAAIKKYDFDSLEPLEKSQYTIDGYGIIVYQDGSYIFVESKFIDNLGGQLINTVLYRKEIKNENQNY